MHAFLSIVRNVVPRPVLNVGFQIFIYPFVKLYSYKFDPFLIRRRTKDKYVFFNIFLLRELALPFDLNPDLIVDAGAYTGLSSLYFALTYPDADIVAVEPEKQNYQVLEKHAGQYPQITPVNKGLWHTATKLEVIDEGAEWGFMVQGAEEDHDVETTTVPDILDDSHHDKVDILKIDIEGSERELFSNNTEWLKHVHVLLVEFHEHKRPGAKTNFYDAIDEGRWKEMSLQDKKVFVNKGLDDRKTT